MPRSLSAVLILCALLRLSLWALTLSDPSIPREPDDYLSMGVALVDSGEFSRPAYPPLYPALLGSLQALFGAQAWRIATGLQVVASILALPLAYDLGKRLYPRGALAFCVLLALDPLLALFPSYLLTEAPFVPMLILLGWLLARAGSSPRRLLPAGLLLGLMLLTRTVTSLLIAGLLPWALLHAWRTRDARFLRQLLLAGAVFLATLLPWMAFNARTHGVFALSSSQDHNFAALYINAGRCRIEAAFCSAQIRPWFPGGTLPDGDPFTVARTARDLALSWALDHPIPVAIATIRGEALRMFTPGSGPWTEIGLGKPAVALSLLWRGSHALLAAIGAAIAWRKAPISRPILWLFLLQYLLLGPIADARFLVPLLPFTAWFGSFALAALAERLQGSSPGP